MKKVREINKAVEPVSEPQVAPPAPVTEVMPAPLSDSESRILRHLVNVQDQTTKDIGYLVGRILSDRQLNVEEWAVSLADYKTIVKRVNSAPSLPIPPVNG